MPPSTHPRRSTRLQPPHETNWLDASWRTSLRRRLIGWYRKNARTLPWRSDPTPYKVWLSEVMLQQTQVVTVLPYFDRFLERFPTIDSLAAADEQNLLMLWEGLGYYRRARSLHAAAKKIVAEHQGQFPTDYQQVLALPGIGRYTAGAILSISRGQKFPVLEGNTQRVFSRWSAVRGNATDRENQKLLWQIAEALLPETQPGRFNQAAMELGALICLPKNPDCEQCPVRSCCEAHRLGLEREIPGKVSRTSYEDRTEFAFVITDSTGQRFLIRKLPAGRRWAGMWDFPRSTETSFADAQLAADSLLDELGTQLEVGARLQSVRHAVTKYRISLHVHHAKLKSARPKKGWRFHSAGDMKSMPMSVTGRKIIDLLAKSADRKQR